MNTHTPRQRHRGMAVAPMLLALLAVSSCLALVAYSFSRTARIGVQSDRALQNAQILTLAITTLATAAADTNNDIWLEGPAGAASNPLPRASGVASNEGYTVPTATGAPVADAWGAPLLYCVWLHHGTVGGTSRIQGSQTPNLDMPGLAVISAGADGTLQTSCSDISASSQHPPTSTAPNGDDAMRVVSIAMLNKGVTGSVFYRDPVANESDLGGIEVQRPGEMRVVTGTGRVFVNTTGLVGQSNWIALDSFVTTYAYPLIAKPVLTINNRKASLNPFSSTLNLSEGAVQFIAYKDAALKQVAKDSGPLAAGSTFDFSAFTPGPGVTYYYVGRRRASRLSTTGTEVWSDFSSPVSAVSP